MTEDVKMRKRGWFYIGVGIIIYLLGIFDVWHLVLRGTSLPFGPIVAGLGVILLIWDYVQARKERSERGDPPTPAP